MNALSEVPQVVLDQNGNIEALFAHVLDAPRTGETVAHAFARGPDLGFRVDTLLRTCVCSGGDAVIEIRSKPKRESS